MQDRMVFGSLCSVSFLARFSYALARNPVLQLFAAFLGAGAEAVGLAVGISTVTGIFLIRPPISSISRVWVAFNTEPAPKNNSPLKTA